MLLPGAVLKMPFHPGGPPYLPHLDFGERATCRQAGRHPLDLPLPILSQGQARGGQLTLPALQVQWMLQLGVDMLPERLPSF